MVRQGLVQIVAGEPADGDIHLRFPHQPTVVNDAQQKAREHQSNRHLGVDARPAVTVTVQTGHFLTQPGQIEHPVYPGQKVVFGDQLTQRTTDEQLQLTALLAPQHLVASPSHTILSKESRPCGFFNSPYVHFLRNALDYVPRKVDDDCLQELRWLYDRRDLAEARADLAAWIGKWQAKYARLVGWVEENIEETLSFYRLPRQHHKHLKSTNMLERLNEEIKRRTHVVRIFPNAESCLRLLRALCVETHENWLEAHRYLNMDYLRELKKEALRRKAA